MSLRTKERLFQGLEEEVGFAQQSIDVQAGVPAVILIVALWTFAHS